ncbi:MAG: hypothetical protein A4E57_04424 [Syntrophorhabdaceae bacterium PtaU1.Bin034]|nr:MAG: hypothetical protein A4E57_04424 [Syntrophorhabdaceae bacterium PtaU1.Bin034]
MAQDELVSTGKMAAMAVFVFVNGANPDEPANTSLKTVSLTWRDEHQKEALKKRVREKAVSEQAHAVVILSDTKTNNTNKHADASSRSGRIIISGITRNLKAGAVITYTLDLKTKTFGSWQMSWLENPVQDFFLEGVFDQDATPGK